MQSTPGFCPDYDFLPERGEDAADQEQA